MSTKLLTVITMVTLIGFTTLGVKQVTNSTNQLELKQIELQSTTSELKSLEAQFTNLNKKYQDKDANLKELDKERESLQKELEQARRDLQAKKAEEARVASLKRLETTVYAAEAPRTTNCGQLRVRMSGLGVPANQLDSAMTLAMRESSCNSNAVNRSSGACGEYQSYPCGKWGKPGTDQYLLGAIKYANDRYGGYNAALSHSLANNWY